MNAAFQQEAGQGDFGRWERFGHELLLIFLHVFRITEKKKISMFNFNRLPLQQFANTLLLLDRKQTRVSVPYSSM